MDLEAVAHDSDKLEVDLVLMLLVVALELVELGEHDGLLGVEMTTKGLADVGDERDHDGEGLGGEGCFVTRKISARGSVTEEATDRDVWR